MAQKYVDSFGTRKALSRGRTELRYFSPRLIGEGRFHEYLTVARVLESLAWKIC